MEKTKEMRNEGKEIKIFLPYLSLIILVIYLKLLKRSKYGRRKKNERMLKLL